MIETYGLTHIALATRDARRAAEFYKRVFGCEVIYDQGGFVQVQTPGSRDVIVFDESAGRVGELGGIVHFGFRLKRAGDIEGAAEAVIAAGGTIRDKGEFAPGEPYLFANDLDGYEVEIWYELPTSADPIQGVEAD